MAGWVYLLGVGPALVSLAFTATEAAPGPRPGVMEENVKRIRKGMTLSEVEATVAKYRRLRHGITMEEVKAILGRSPHSLRPKNDMFGSRMDREGRLVPPPQVGWDGVWQGEDGEVFVSFDLNRKVLESFFRRRDDKLRIWRIGDTETIVLIPPVADSEASHPGGLGRP
jgi:hypothetical protein